ncbi:MAG: phosphoserine phosphatase [Pseudohongiella sp.]|nr:MAG: phosphoserine phosphatase [Pseudohongiella sp.]
MESNSSGKLALFDLDNTLLNGDSDHAWGEFLISKNLVEEEAHRQKNDYFYDQYKQGALDIHGYVAFTLEPVMQLDSDQRSQLHAEFMAHSVEPIVLEKGLALVRSHVDAGDFCVIITATNEFIATPIAKLFQPNLVIATELQIVDDRYTGEISGTPCYQGGKVTKLKAWIDQQGHRFDLSQAIFYSDSINDLPLLEVVATPVAVDPDQSLLNKANSAGWKTLSLRS